jgi:hypothetical protein
MRTNLILASGAVAALLWVSSAGAGSPEAGPALALSPETSCESAKLLAAGAYAECLAHAASAANAVGGELDDAAIEPCNARFDRAFERAEANGGCRTAGGPATLRGPIRRRMEETLAAVTSGPGCWERPYTSLNTYVCQINAFNGGGSRSAIDLAAMASQINLYFGSGSVTADTVVWIEAFGADGAHGATGNGGSGGPGGFAQMTTTVNGLREFFGTSEIYYYLGKKGSGSNGGGGGTGTIVTVNDLTRDQASLGTTLVLAGGGGGGGAGRQSDVCKLKQVLGASGGAGGEAISTLGTAAFGAGAKGGERRNQNYSGSGGGGTLAGTGGGVNGKGSADVGDDGIAALGGQGGNQVGPNGGFTNQSGVKVTLSGGQGGGPGYDTGGGGGGGGYGGGGGAQGVGDTDCVAGGGGAGGSMARASAVSCPRSREPFNPGAGQGAIYILFDRGRCG